MKPLFISPKISLQYSVEKGNQYLSVNRIEQGELLMRIPLKGCVHAKRDDTLVLFTYPLLQLVDVSKYYDYTYYKNICPMYLPIYQLESTCRKLNVCFRTIAIQYLSTLHVLFCHRFVFPNVEFTHEEFERIVHAYHIVDTRCVEDMRTGDIYLANYFDNLNHSAVPNVSYIFSDKYLLIKAHQPIAPYTEICVSYGNMSREKMFSHYFFTDDSGKSVSTYPEGNERLNFDVLLGELLKDENKYMNIYDFYVKYRDDKKIVFHMEQLFR